VRLLSLLLAFRLVASTSVQANTLQSAVTAVQPSTLLQQSLAALVGNTRLSDVTLTGTVRRVAGSDDETGTATLKAITNGSARIDLSLPSGLSSEISNLFAAPSGVWSSADGVSHPIALHNLLSEPAWFFPAFGIARRLSGMGFVTTVVGTETHNGQTVQHISVSQATSAQVGLSGPALQHLTQIEFYLDPVSLLPVALGFNTHPDNNELLDIPAEVDFSDYRAVNGAQVPFHVQKSLNGSLNLDFQVETVTFNTGLSASTFSAH